MAAIGTGSRVLDVAAGAGEQSLAVARRVGSEGWVLATDISPSILRFAGQSVQAEGLNNVAARELDGEDLSVLEEGSFDAVISRVGMIYFPDQQRALAGMRRVLKENGKVAAAGLLQRRVQRLFLAAGLHHPPPCATAPPLPGQPGPFSLGSVDVLENTFQAAGFRDIEVEAVQAPVVCGSAKECLRFEKASFGALHQMLSGLSAVEQEAAWEEIEEALEAFEEGDGFCGPCEMLIAVGNR